MTNADFSDTDPLHFMRATTKKYFLLVLIPLFTQLSSSQGIAKEIETKKGAIQFFNQGADQEKQNKLRGATVFYNLAILSDNRSMEARNKLGEIYRRRKLYDRAIAEHEQAKRVDPFFVSNLNNLALAYLKKGNYKASLREAQAALRIRSDFGPAHYTLAAVYDLIGQFNLALEHFNRSIQLGFQNDFEHLDIVKSYWKTTKSLR